MIQDIAPSRLYNEYRECSPKDGDVIYIFDEKGRVLLGDDEGHILFVRHEDIPDARTIYLFSIDEQRFFMSLDLSDCQRDGYEYVSIREVRDRFSGTSMSDVYSVFTAYHLWRW
ncbi:MAG: NAD(+) diphosphatase, partial [Lachnospiraceae bacterium]|nr:NAD(+) diphosphatase [Lachnospiraceae bacterium]